MYTMAELLSKIAGKAMATTTTFAGALLNTEKADRYIRKLQNKTIVLPEARQITMRATTRDIDRVFFNTRILTTPNVEGVDFLTANMTGPSVDKQTLTAVKAMSVVPLTDELIEENIEREAFESTLLDMIAERVGLDVEEWGINGDADTPSADTLFALNNGWLIQGGRRVQEDAAGEINDAFTTGGAETTQVLDGHYHVPFVINKELFSAATPTAGSFIIYSDAYDGTILIVDKGDGTLTDKATGAVDHGTIDYYSGDISIKGLTVATKYWWNMTPRQFDRDTLTTFPLDMFDLMLLCVPKAYLKVRSEWRFYVPWYIEDYYRNILIARKTAYADQMLAGDSPIAYKGIPVVVVNSMPEDRAWLTHPNNTVYGVFRDITMEAEREAKAQRTDFINSLRVDFAYEDPENAIVAEIYNTTTGLDLETV